MCPSRTDGAARANACLAASTMALLRRAGVAKRNRMPSAGTWIAYLCNRRPGGVSRFASDEHQDTMKDPIGPLALRPPVRAPMERSAHRAPMPQSAERLPDLFPEPLRTPPKEVRSLLARVSDWNHRRLERRRAQRLRTAQRARHSYQMWIDQFDTVTPVLYESFKLRARDLEARPLISILMPVYNPCAEHLAAAVRSVRNQIYGDWELCIADDASTTPDTRQWLSSVARDDPRIKLLFREQNGHISAASNSALSLASGDFIALLDQDDLLRPHTLLIVAEALDACPDAAVLYSDEDKIDADGQRTGHYFKCDWNAYLFRSHNLVSHFGVYRRDLVQQVGGFRTGFEGAQDYDLALRCCERVAARQIVHLPFILYHWRMHDRSTAAGIGVKPYAARAAQRAIQEHLERMGIDGRVEITSCGYRVRYALRADPPRVSIIIPTRNGVKLLRTSVNSVLEKTDYPDFEVIVIDNGSDDPETLHYLRYIAGNERVRVLRDDRPFNYAQLNNGAVRQCTSAYVCLLNNDIEIVTPGWLREMMSLAQFDDVGAVGAKLLYPDGLVQHGGVIVGIGGVAAHAHKDFGAREPGYSGRAALIQEFSAVTAACLLVRRETYLEVGGLDERRLAVAFNDVDFCMKLRAHGYRNVWTPNAVLYHHESVSRGLDDNPRKAARFAREADYIHYRWEAVIRHDPAYSPNLSLHSEHFELAFPPRVALGDACWSGRMRALAAASAAMPAFHRDMVA
jgi:glycosyltransferase involved in cell wall biosynthesis